jgi:phosphohistidine phosphatase SixA/8-oxo-dGTP pyrophosphatase MutT (NUDIX family)
MANGARLIEAAGGLLWRPAVGGTGIEICVVHRPKYNDWSLPKGKLGRGEHVLVGAVREVAEETGFTATVGVPLGEIRYLKDGLPKRVRYWAMRVASGAFRINAEVDRLDWRAPSAALAAVGADRDMPVIARFSNDPVDTVPLVVLRHASAGDATTWPGDDHDRPLDDLGREQATAFAELLPLLGITSVVSADVVRCLDTVGLFAEKAALPVQADPLLSEHGYEQHPAAVAERVHAVAAAREPVVLCTQGPVIPDIVRTLCDEFGHPLPDDPSLRKGTAWVFHLAVHEPRIVAMERVAGLA